MITQALATSQLNSSCKQEYHPPRLQPGSLPDSSCTKTSTLQQSIFPWERIMAHGLSSFSISGREYFSYIFLHTANYHSHHTCSTIELAKACNDSQINQNLRTRRFWNVMSDLMPENGGPFFSKLFLKSVSLHLDFHTEAHNQDMACGSNVIGRRRGINRCYPSILGAVLFFLYDTLY